MWPSGRVEDDRTDSSEEGRALGDRGRSCGRLALVVTDDEREDAWGTIHDVIGQMPGWAVEPCTYNGDDGLWHITAIDLRPRGRYAKREAITATGVTEIAALDALTALLEVRQVSRG